MSTIEQSHMSLAELFESHPSVKGYLENSDTQTVQIHEGAIISSAKERLELLDEDGETYALIKQDVRTAILAACDDEPLVRPEIAQYLTLLGHVFSSPDMDRIIYEETPEHMSRVDGMTYIHINYGKDVYTVFRNVRGFLTTDLGRDKLVNIPLKSPDEPIYLDEPEIERTREQATIAHAFVM